MAGGDYFGAHEVLEQRWRIDHHAAPQVAIWWAALSIHWRRAHFRGARALLAKMERKVAVHPALAGAVGPLIQDLGPRLDAECPFDPVRDVDPWLDRVADPLTRLTPPIGSQE